MITPDTQKTAIERELNVTPMLDVMLVLLVIFMAMAVAMHHTMDVQLPVECPGVCESSTKVVLEVHPGPRYLINGVAVDPGELASRLASIYATRPEKILQVAGFDGATYQQVVTAMDIARASGVREIGATDLRPHAGK